MAFGDVVQDKTGRTAAGGASTLQVTQDSSITEDNLLVAVAHSRASSISTPSGWSAAVSLEDVSETDSLYIFYKVAGASESTSVTFDDSTAGQVMLAYVAEIEGPWESSPLDATSSATDSNGGTSHQAGSTGTLSQADEFCIVGCMPKFGGSGGSDDASSPSVDSSFTLQTGSPLLFAGYTFGGGTDTYPSYLFASTYTASATTALNPDTSWTTGSDFTFSVIATFKKSGGGGGLSIPVAMRHYRNLRTA
jgi:hypothetical protein